MARTKSLALNTVPQNIVVWSVCSTLLIKEDESVASWPTTGFIIKKPAITGDANFISPGKSYSFVAALGSNWIPGQILGQIYLVSGSTTAIQDES